jgi:superfamily II DNA or RNA helicase
VTSYTDFLARKTRTVQPLGEHVDTSDVHPLLHPWQARIVQWAVRTGRCALWEDTGLGKTFQQLEWARLSGDTALVVAPLAVSQQTIREAAKLGIDARYVRHGDQITGPGVWVTNYEMAERFDADRLDAVVLDEASILKAHDGKTRTALIRHFAPVPRRLACTATPAPNDPEELTNQAEFLGVCSRVDMLATFFIHDDEGWRLKGHAADPMYRWMASWAMAARKPSDVCSCDCHKESSCAP